MTHVTERVTAQAAVAAEQSQEFVKDHALQSALAVFGIGVGAGLVVASLLHDSLQTQHTTMTQRLGQQMLDTMSSAIPNAFTRR